MKQLIVVMMIGVFIVGCTSTKTSPTVQKTGDAIKRTADQVYEGTKKAADTVYEAGKKAEDVVWDAM